MDALTFASPILIRKMTFASSSGKVEVQQISYDKAIEGLQLTHDQFVDLCILLGCDYCDTIKGIGPKTALKLIREHGCIEEILKCLNREKYVVPESYEPKKRKREETSDDDNEEDEDEKKKGKPKEEEGENDEPVPVYIEARKLFNQHQVLSTTEIEPLLKWKECQPEPLKAFLVDECGFNPERVQSSIEKLQKAHKATSKPQMRMDEFFKVKPKAGGVDNKKRKVEEDKKGGKGKKGKGGGGGFYKKK